MATGSAGLAETGTTLSHMPTRRWTTALLAATLLVTAVPGCSSDKSIPEDPPRPMSARLIMDGDSKTYELSMCSQANDTSLISSGSDKVGRVLVISISDGAGSVSALNQAPEPNLTGDATSFTIDDAQEFDITGTVEVDGKAQDFRVWGSCAPKPSTGS